MNIVLHEPGIASNTGNIGRTCVSTGTGLHLIRPYAFRINEKELKRAGMDYWKDVELCEYLDYEDFLSKHPGLLEEGADGTGADCRKTQRAAAGGGDRDNCLSDIHGESAWTLSAGARDVSGGSSEAGPRLWFATTKARQSYTDVSFGPDDYIMFGNESRGIPEEILISHPERCIRIPMSEGARSLNLANSAAVVLYEALRQNSFPGLLKKGNLHRLSWPEAPAVTGTDSISAREAGAGADADARSLQTAYIDAIAPGQGQISSAEGYAKPDVRLISLIVSVYNEEGCLRKFYDTAKGILDEFCRAEGIQPGIPETSAEPGVRSVSGGGSTVPAGNRPDSAAYVYDYEILFVNDGSTDQSGSILKELRALDPQHVSCVTFSRNFGHEAAMTAGLDRASGDFLVFLDADLQHPPELIPRIIAELEAGSEVISMVRTSNSSAGGAKNLTSSLFYKFINHISDVRMLPGASDFFALDRKAAGVLRQSYREKTRFLRGYVQDIGFKRTALEYEAAARAAGESHYSLRRLWRLSMDTIVCFSDLPLKAGILAGVLAGALCLVLLIRIVYAGDESGILMLSALVCFMSAVIFVLIGIIGSYMAALLREAKDRPIYIIEDFEKAAGSDR